VSPSLASLLCAVGIGGLFFLDRDKSVRTSFGLWVSVTWLWIVGSRPASVWLGINPITPDPTAQLGDGSPFDRNIFILLLVAGIIVLIARKRRTTAFLKASWPVLMYFTFGLISVLWSDFADIAIKRWIKAVGDVVIVLIIVTEVDPVAALKRLFARVGFVLMSASILLIKYYPALGRAYDPDGMPMNTGVTINKNMLGVTTLVIAIGALWVCLNLLNSKTQQNRGRHLLAHITLLVFSVVVLVLSHSATSLACFGVSTVLICAMYLPLIRKRPKTVHALVLVLVATAAVVVLFGGHIFVTHALGRETNLTGRTDIWAAVLPVVPNPIVGAGFESFWLGPRLEKVYANLSDYMHVNEAHNGYIEVYLNLGWVGVCLIVAIIVSGYRGSVAAFRRDRAIGSLMLAYVASAVIYSATEAGFRMLDPIWIFLILAVVGARGIAAGIVQARQSDTRSNRVPGTLIAHPNPGNAAATIVSTSSAQPFPEASRLGSQWQVLLERRR
jgi:exopolysaccharide production protein ExoQ